MQTYKIINVIYGVYQNPLKKKKCYILINSEPILEFEEISADSHITY